jgi:HD-GYP domain-containing protein (c-di-GMP phosphodiesterase class II)
MRILPEHIVIDGCTAMTHPMYSPLRLAELVTALSLATDIGAGMPMELMLSACLMSVRLGEALYLSDDDLRVAYYLSLLHHAGCTADSPRAAELMGNELGITREWFSANPTQPLQMMNVVWRSVVDQNEPTLARFGLLLRSMSEFPLLIIARCEVAQQLAARLDFDTSVQAGLRQFGERWDGAGFPHKLQGEAILLPLRLAQVAHDAVAIHHFFGLEAAIAAMRQRAGVTLDPVIVEAFCAHAATLLEMPLSLRDTVLACEPEPHRTLTDAQMESATRALADFADLQTPFSTGHSTAVAALAEQAARQCRLPDPDVTLARRAGYLHDIGRVGVSAGVWGKAGPLSEADWERVRLHPYYAQRILAQPQALAELGIVAGAHHERLDGSGYHRNLPANLLTPIMRLLAAAEAYQAMIERRPYRAALSPEHAANELKREARAGRLDGEMVNAVLAAAGHRTPEVRRQRVADLTEREMEVLRLVACGQTNPEIAQNLTISRKTVSRHLENIYSKLNVSTRAAATYFAMHHYIV